MQHEFKESKKRHTTTGELENNSCAGTQWGVIDLFFTNVLKFEPKSDLKKKMGTCFCFK